MKAKFLKFLKWFIIIVLVVGAVGLTVFMFFRNYNKKQIKQVDLNDVLTSTNKQNFDNQFDEIVQILSENGQTVWFLDLKTTSTKLDNSLDVLINYYVDSNFVVYDAQISSTYSYMINTRNLLNNMFDEYITKSESQYFSKLVGANDIYNVYSNYLVKYADFVQAVNNNLKSRSDFDITSDIKFSIIDLQTRITNLTFSKVLTSEELFKIENNSNIQKINSYVEYNNSLINGINNMSIDSIRFISCYENCNKTYFAEHFNEEITNVTTINSSSTNEQKSAYYLKKIF